MLKCHFHTDIIEQFSLRPRNHVVCFTVLRSLYVPLFARNNMFFRMRFFFNAPLPHTRAKSRLDTGGMLISPSQSTSTYINLHQPTSTYIYLHLPTSTYIYLHLPCIYLCIYPYLDEIACFFV